MEKMISIAFTSSMKRGLSKAARLSMVMDAQIHNERVAISSVLLYCDGSFMQYMEGPARNLDAVYARIENDARHRGVIQLFHRQISEREFDRSAMRYCEASEDDSGAVAVADWLRPVAGQSNPGRVVLSGFWANNNGLHTKH